MPKRKSSDPLPPSKRARLTQARDTLDPESFLTNDTQREKRKRPAPLSSDSNEERKTKRARTSTGSSDATTDSLNIHAEPWPSIEDLSGEVEVPAFTNEETATSRESSSDLWPTIPYEPKPSEELDLGVLAFQIAGEGHVCDCEDHLLRRYNHAYTMLSPEPSDYDASETDNIEDTFVHENIPRAPRSILKPHPIPIPELPKASPRSRRSVTARRRIGKRRPVSTRQEEPRQQRHKNQKNNRRQPRKETHSPVMEKFLQSKRSSRRGPACELWCLDDNGKACEITGSRR